MSEVSSGAREIALAIYELADKQQRQTEELYRIYQCLDRILQALLRLDPDRD